MPPSLDEWLPDGHLARFVAELVDEVLDLGPILAAYKQARGYPPYDPRLMVRLLVYGYSVGVRSSRAIERKCVDDVAFRFLAADCAHRAGSTDEPKTTEAGQAAADTARPK